jgi:hypothetical protein
MNTLPASGSSIYLLSLKKLLAVVTNKISLDEPPMQGQVVCFAGTGKVMCAETVSVDPSE